MQNPKLRICGTVFRKKQERYDAKMCVPAVFDDMQHSFLHGMKPFGPCNPSSGSAGYPRKQIITQQCKIKLQKVFFSATL